MAVDLQRRRALRQAAALCSAGPAFSAGASASARVVVVGGGFAGASCAGALKRLWPRLQVLLFEPRRRFVAGPMANAMLAGLRDPAAVSATPAGLAALGVDWRAEAVAELDPVRLRVRDGAGRWHAADRLVLAPGIDLVWDGIAGLDAGNSARMPHGWLGDASMRALRQRFAALRDGATVLIGVPAHPYRCPPGPYERASLFAWALRGRRAKLLVADAKDDFSLRPLFQRAWARLPGSVEWWPRAQGGEVVAVDTARGEVRLAGGERVRPDLACIIPAQQAAALCHAADLVDETGWCPVQADSFASLRHAGVHVLGDAAAAYPLPKSAMAAHGAALACAAAICAALRGEAAPPPPQLQSQCYSLLAPEEAIALHGDYAALAGRMSALRQRIADDGDAAQRAREARAAQAWWRALLRDSFAGQ
ncbi:FAD/NAD(P)-binding oxidoreductase [Pseudorhodoferax sp. LjRoot39]|uniref:FCSD flavin-binding domain-containing protein n=1 Tax=Pseudorhodoferax sp. LjRoot39 TaxID=3342328 RepID=UPI003ECFA947